MLLRITPEAVIDDSEIAFSASRGGGPGGQHVNKTSSRVLLEFDVTASPSLTGEQKALLERRLGTRLTKDGRLQVTGAEYRSPHANRQAALERRLEILRWGLRPEPEPRRATSPGKAARERRLMSKKQRGEIKRSRGKPEAGE